MKNDIKLTNEEIKMLKEKYHTFQRLHSWRINKNVQLLIKSCKCRKSVKKKYFNL
jgi:hypothetical protein